MFFREQIGLNILLFNIFIIGILQYFKMITLNTLLNKISIACLLLSCLAVVFHHSTIALVVHIINWILFIGCLNYSQSKRLSTWFTIGIISSFEGLGNAYKSFSKRTKSNKTKTSIRSIKLYVLPIIILYIFHWLYRFANPVFDSVMSKFWLKFSNLFTFFDFTFIPILILGCIISAPILYRKQYLDLETEDLNANDNLIRKRIKKSFKILDLKNEYQSAVFLFVSLNLLLILLLGFDIYTVWFNFEFVGQTLRDFVHQGTYVLIFTILISIGLVLFFFRQNLNFYSLNTNLKRLSSSWIILNGILSLSVGVRCYYYIANFGLAYKRIGLIAFLIAVIYGLYTVYRKINHQYSVSYLLRKNVLAIFIITNSLALFNWDIIIAKYNISNYKKSYIEFSFLSTLSYSALPYLDLDREQLNEIYELHSDKFNFSVPGSNSLYITKDDYLERIAFKKSRFMEKWRNKNWLSWNYAEYSAYHKITTHHE